MRLPIIVLLSCIAASAMALEIGQKAPALDGVTWVKGAAPEGAGITVVECWATWCAPCRETIPHLTGLQQRYGDAIRVVGLSHEDAAKVTPFVAKMGASMDYRVGIASDAMYVAYMGEGPSPIPFAFLMDASGTVVWSGHPLRIDRPLARLVAGSYDVEAAKVLASAEAELDAALEGERPDLKRAMAALDRILQVDPVNPRGVGLLVAIARREGGPQAVRGILSGVPIERLDAAAAIDLAWARATDSDLSTANLDLALAFIRRGLELEPGNPSAIDTHARVLYALGMVPAAIAEQERAVQAAPGDQEYADALERYRAILALQAKAVP